jgi:hypothetical protein
VWVKNKKETINDWTRPIDEVVIRTFRRVCKSSLSEIKKVASINIVVGGDHGQGKFRAVIKIIIRFTSVGVEPKVVVIKVGHIEAKKDTYKILLNVASPSMNKAMKRIKVGGNVLRAFDYTETGAVELTFSNVNQPA